MNGWTGTILRVDLTAGSFKKEALDPELAKKFLGGRGLGSKIIYDEVDATSSSLPPVR